MEIIAMPSFVFVIITTTLIVLMALLAMYGASKQSLWIYFPACFVAILIAVSTLAIDNDPNKNVSYYCMSKQRIVGLGPQEEYSNVEFVDTCKIIFNHADGIQYIPNDQGKLVSIKNIIENNQCRNCDLFKKQIKNWPSMKRIFIYKVYNENDSSLIYSCYDDKYLNSLIKTTEKP